jgi:hypothetical protein
MNRLSNCCMNKLNTCCWTSPRLEYPAVEQCFVLALGLNYVYVSNCNILVVH